MTPRVIVGHAANHGLERFGLYPRTVEALERLFPVPVDYEDCSRHDSAYFDLLSAAWDDKRDLIVVEHDIVVHDRVWRAFRHCPQPWCAFPYEMSTMVKPGLGCTRWRASLMHRVPDLFSRVARHGNDAEVRDGMPSRHWLRLDVRIDAELMPRGFAPHVHWPQVEHLNPIHKLHRHLA
ncbi:MAG TPA: hypothetical protein VMV41_09750 [Cellulomonadaceae bacterium]|nr:hypothetical protein [Cellulomonadaceae bacterium]